MRWKKRMTKSPVANLFSTASLVVLQPTSCAGYALVAVGILSHGIVAILARQLVSERQPLVVQLLERPHRLHLDHLEHERLRQLLT